MFHLTDMSLQLSKAPGWVPKQRDSHSETGWCVRNQRGGLPRGSFLGPGLPAGRAGGWEHLRLCSGPPAGRCTLALSLCGAGTPATACPAPPWRTSRTSSPGGSGRVNTRRGPCSSVHTSGPHPRQGPCGDLDNGGPRPSLQATERPSAMAPSPPAPASSLGPRTMGGGRTQTLTPLSVVQTERPGQEPVTTGSDASTQLPPGPATS